MPWFRIDDGFADHPKVMQCSLAAIGLWTKAGAWCAKHMTDGRVPAKMVRALGGTTKQAAELVDAGLWSKHSEGFEFHEWSARNPTREAVLEKRRLDAERKDRERRNPRPVRADKQRTDEGHKADGAPESEDVPRARARVPVPAQEEKEEEGHCVPQPLPISDEERADADALANDPARRVTAHDAYLAWNREAQQHGHRFDRHNFRAEWNAVAETCNATRRPKLALDTLCAWLWTAPDGPVRAGRIKASRMSPARTGRALNEDLDHAQAWMLSGGRAA